VGRRHKSVCFCPSAFLARIAASRVARYVNGAKSGAFSGKASTLRYIGTMVGDVHRTLLYGGIFFYPKDKKDGKGKLRHLYECGPMAHTMSLAGGAASTGTEDVLLLQPTSIHGRVPIWIGSKLDVEDAERMYREHP
jgi:fructose-1,6-bisphosphatase I